MSIVIIEKTTTIKFDCDAERQRILSAFENGPLQDKLIKVVNDFERGDKEAVAATMNDFKPEEWEFLHWTITDVMTDFVLSKGVNKLPIEYRFIQCKL